MAHRPRPAAHRGRRPAAARGPRRRAAPRPRLLAEVPGLALLEDLHPRVALWDLLAADGAAPAAVAGLLDHARALGRLAALTAGPAPGRASGRLEVFGPHPWTDPSPALDAAGLGFGRARSELDAALASLAEPGPFLAFSNGDAGANNYLCAPAAPGHGLTGPDGRIIDFEHAGHRHALLDGSCLFVPGPMWLTVADPVPLGVADAYRAALAAGVPRAEDDAAWGAGLAAAALVSAAHRLDRIGLLDGRPPGHTSRLQMVATLEAAARTARHVGALPALAGWAESAASGLRRRWPDADVDTASWGYTTRDRVQAAGEQGRAV